MGVGELILLGLAVVAVAIAIFLLYRRNGVGGEMALMAGMETSRAGDVAAKPVGSLVELKGKLRAEPVLTSEFAKLPCVYYRALTEREVERSRNNAKGERERERSYETLTDVVKFAPSVVVDDGTGRAAVDLTGAKV